MIKNNFTAVNYFLSSAYENSWRIIFLFRDFLFCIRAGPFLKLRRRRQTLCINRGARKIKRKPDSRQEMRRLTNFSARNFSRSGNSRAVTTKPIRKKDVFNASTKILRTIFLSVAFDVFKEKKQLARPFADVRRGKLNFHTITYFVIASEVLQSAIRR